MTKRKPVVYEGSGSAIANYMSATPKDSDNWAIFDKNNEQHKHVLSLARQLQWTTPHERHGEVADLTRISEWLKTNSPVRKKLKKMEPSELTRVINAMSAMIIKKY